MADEVVPNVSDEVFPAADVKNELNPGDQNENLAVDPNSFQEAPTKDIEEEAEVAAKKSQKEKESEKKDSLQCLKSAIIVSGVIVAVIGAIFALTKKLKEK